MKIQEFEVCSLGWTGPEAAQHDVRLRSTSGLEFWVMMEGERPSLGEVVRVSEMFFIDERPEEAPRGCDEDEFKQSSGGEFSACGRIVALVDGDAVVDCMGVQFNVGYVGHDPKWIGERIRFSGSRIDAERAP